MCWRWFNAQVFIGAVAFTISVKSRKKTEWKCGTSLQGCLNWYFRNDPKSHLHVLAFISIALVDFFSCGVNKNEVYRLKFCRLQRNDFINFNLQISFLKSHFCVLRVGDTAKPEVWFFFCFTTSVKFKYVYKNSKGTRNPWSLLTPQQL